MIKVCEICEEEFDCKGRGKTCSSDCGSELKKLKTEAWKRRNPDKVKSMFEKTYAINKNKYIGRKKEKFHGLKDGLYYNYLLPKEKYSGMTQFPPTEIPISHKRLNNHANNYGRYIDDVEWVGFHDNYRDSKLQEYEYQAKGWIGCNSKQPIIVNDVLYACCNHYALKYNVPVRTVSSRCASTSDKFKNYKYV